ncbi:MAG: dihydrolipoamide acetyltransferase family protein [Dehalococcoidia bacterium]
MATSIRMPQLGMIMTEGTLAKWLKGPGETVQQGEPLAEITTEKITYELEAPEAGIFQPVAQEGEVVSVQGLIAYLLAEGESMPEPPQRREPATPPAASRGPRASSPAPASEAVQAAPGARRLAARLGIDISLVPPSRPGGRIIEADVQSYADEAKAPGPAAPVPETPSPSRVEAIQGMRRAIAENMRRSLADSAQLTFHLDVDMTEAVAARRRLSRGSNVTLSTVDIFLKACAEALVRHPQLNSALRDGSIHYFDEVNIALAVALEDGLVAPVIRDVCSKDIFQLARERASLVARAQKGKLLPDDLAGGTFTLTVLGSVDGFTPILNPGQSAILGVGRVAKKPAVVGDELVARQMATLSLTVDHQVVDGAPAASFLRRLQQILERPESLFRAQGS